VLRHEVVRERDDRAVPLETLCDPRRGSRSQRLAAARSVCHDGFGWEIPRRSHDSCLVDASSWISVAAAVSAVLVRGRVPSLGEACADVIDLTHMLRTIESMRNAHGCALAIWLACGLALAEGPHAVEPPIALQVHSELSPLVGTTDLKFRDFFSLPVGPRGLVPSERLLGLAGQRVRVVGYMARQEQPSAGILIVAPVPVVLGDEDESFSDDLPATAIYVHLTDADSGRGVRWMPGLLRFSGVLRIGATSEADGRMSFVRLELDPELSHAITVAR